MNTYNRYKNDRDLAWKIILDTGIRNLPVKIVRVCNSFNIKVKGCNMESSGKTALSPDGGYIILINSREPPKRQRFTCAHELGHILLGHVDELGKAYRDPQTDDNPYERDANIFASRLLAPAIILKDIGAFTAEDISRVCDISMEAARFRAERLNLLMKREQEFMKTKNRSCFGISRYEREVEKQFTEFIVKFNSQ